MEHYHCGRSRVRLCELSGCHSCHVDITWISVMKFREKNPSSYCIHYVFTTIMNVYKDFINLFNLCLYWALCWCAHRHKHSHTFYSYSPLFSPSLPSLQLPSPTIFLSFALCCCKAFPWLAVINLPSLGAGSWLRASERSYKAKTAIQKQSRFSCFQNTT